MIRDWRNLQGKTIKLRSAERKANGKPVTMQPHVVVESCRMGKGIDGDLANLIHADSTGPFYFRAVGCCDWAGRPLKDVEVWR